MFQCKKSRAFAEKGSETAFGLWVEASSNLACSGVSCLTPACVADGSRPPPQLQPPGYVDFSWTGTATTLPLHAAAVGGRRGRCGRYGCPLRLVPYTSEPMLPSYALHVQATLQLHLSPQCLSQPSQPCQLVHVLARYSARPPPCAVGSVRRTSICPNHMKAGHTHTHARRHLPRIINM